MSAFVDSERSSQWCDLSAIPCPQAFWESSCASHPPGSRKRGWPQGQLIYGVVLGGRLVWDLFSAGRRVTIFLYGDLNLKWGDQSMLFQTTQLWQRIVFRRRQMRNRRCRTSSLPSPKVENTFLFVKVSPFPSPYQEEEMTISLNLHNKPYRNNLYPPLVPPTYLPS